MVVPATVAELAMALRYHAERRVRPELARFSYPIGKITVLIAEDRKPNGNNRTRCSRAAGIAPSGLVFADHSGPEPYLTVTEAIQRLADALEMRDREGQDSERLIAADESEVLTGAQNRHSATFGGLYEA